MKLSSIYSKKLPKFNLEKQLNTICKRKHVSYKNNIVKKKTLITTQILKVITTQKLTSQQKKTKEENKNRIKNSWSKGTYVIVGDSMVASIDERKMSSKRPIVRSFSGATCSDMYHLFVPILEKQTTM